MHTAVLLRGIRPCVLIHPAQNTRSWVEYFGALVVSSHDTAPYKIVILLLLLLLLLLLSGINHKVRGRHMTSSEHHRPSTISK